MLKNSSKYWRRDIMKKLIITGVIVVVIIAVGGVLAKTKLFPKKDNTVEINVESPPEMPTAVVELGDISEVITASGTIEPLKIVEVSSKASGKIISMPVDKGDYLNEGDLIAEIEKTYAQNDVDQAEADLRSAQARLEQTKINLGLEKKQRQSSLSQAEKNLEDAETRLAQLEEQLALDRVANKRKLEEADNNLKISQLQLKMLSPELVREEEVERSKASVIQAKANLDLSQKEFDRKKNLYERNYISKAELDSAQTKLDAQQAQYDSAEQQLKIVQNPATEENLELARANVKKSEFAIQAAEENRQAEKSSEREIEMQKTKIKLMKMNLELAQANLEQIKVREKDITTAEASLSRSESQLETAKERLNDTHVTAPISGTILDKNVEEGQVITSKTASAVAEGKPLVTMADLARIYVRTDVDETDIGKVHPEQSVEITVDAFPNQTFSGEVLKVAPQGKETQNVTTFEVTTELTSQSDLLKPGMKAAVKIMASSAQNALLVPNEAIMNFGGRQMVRVVGEERPRPVEIGASNWEKTEIVSGLDEGEVVVISGRPGPGGGGPDFMQRMRQRGGSGGGRGPRPR